MIGGDLYVVQSTPHGTRIMVGDVRGKGLGAVNAVCADIGAFRYAAYEAEDLGRLVPALERALVREGGRRGGVEQHEGFTTALLAEFSADLDVVGMITLGHAAGRRRHAGSSLQAGNLEGRADRLAVVRAEGGPGTAR